jgi:hypothetical protein
MSRGDWLPLDTRAGKVMWAARWVAGLTWVLFLTRECLVNGVPFDREGIILWMGLGLLAYSVGRHPIWLLWVAVDFLPFAGVLIAYDYLRGLSDGLGMPTWWHPQVDLDKAMFFGHDPTVWLQEHLKHPDVRWYDVVVCLCYFSFFFLPYLTAGVLWLRSRADFYRWSLRFVSLSLFGFTMFALIPSAPPWAAANCTAAQVADHPSNPWCMYYPDPNRHGGVLGAMTSHQPGASPWVQRISTRGFSELHLKAARSLIDKGQGTADQVAAIPSLHLAGTLLFCIFMWPRLNKWWRPLLVAYPLLMTFSLVYSAEHYVTDCVAGALAAVLITFVANRIERWRARRKVADTLEEPSDTATLENQCPSTETMPSST